MSPISRVDSAAVSWVPLEPGGLDSTDPLLVAGNEKGAGCQSSTTLGADKPFAILDTAGHVLATILTPPDALFSVASENISPNLRYLVYYSGTIDNEGEGGFASLGMHVIRLADNQEILSMKILPKEYPANFNRAVNYLANHPELVETRLVNASSLRIAAEYGICSFAWSPDGEQLAFAAILDGDSSDVYIFSLATETLHRISDDPAEVDQIAWINDGKGVRYDSAFFLGAGPLGTTYFSNTQNSTHPVPVCKPACDAALITDTLVLSYPRYPILFPSRLDITDLSTGVTQPLWNHPFMAFAFDNFSKTLLLTAPPDDTLTGGTYAINIDTLSPSRIFDAFLDIGRLGASQYVAMESRNPNALCFFSSTPSRDFDFSGCPMDANSSSFSILEYYDAKTSAFLYESPDGEVFFWGVRAQMSLSRKGHSAIGGVTQIVSLPESHFIGWSSDSKFLVVQTRAKKYLIIDTSSGESRPLPDSERYTWFR
jgi:hypothetical protein